MAGSLCGSRTYPILVVLFTNFASVSVTCIPGLSGLGYTFPKGDILIEYDTKPLEITCVVTNFSIENPSKHLVFFKNGIEVNANVTILNDTSIRLYEEHLTKSKHTYYVCLFKEDEEHKSFVCANYVAVGTKPLAVTDFQCINQNYDNLTCTWTAPENHVHTTYDLTYTFELSTSRISRCPAITTDGNKKSCFWNIVTVPHYRQSQPIYNFVLTMNNTFGINSLAYVFDNFKYDCGHKSSSFIGVKNAKKAEYPWQAVIYFEKKYICSGSIITPRVILTAAHCFDIIAQEEKYQIGVGKLYRTYEDSKDTDAQYQDVQHIRIPPEFYNGAHLTFDIALVIVKQKFQITKFVQLICLDRTQFQDSSLPNAEGVITGWVSKETGNPSEILNKLQAKYVTTKECKKMLPRDFRTYYTPDVPDKICAGVLNSNKSFCPGEGGAPLAFLKEGDDCFYVRGVASVGPSKSNKLCDASNVMLYTSVAFHKDFILKNLAKYKEKPGLGCILPKHTKKSKWSLPYKPRITEQSSQKVEEGTIIKFECDVGYKFYPEFNQKYWYTACRESKWDFLPECRKTCESRITTNRLIITCDLDGSKVNCENPYVGTIAKMECAHFYENPSIKYTSRHYCLETGWDYQLPICEPECGISSVQPQRLVIGGNETKSGDYPWQVAIFFDEEQLCGGSIISQKIILTAGHCFEHPDKVERYKVGAGKLYRTYKDARDLYAQYSNVQKIEIFDLDIQFRGDIAVIILETPFKLTAFVRPVCFDGEDFNDLQLVGETGIVTGWGYISETGNSSEALKELRVNYFTRKNCTKHIRRDFEQYYSYDKICAGVLTKDENVCQGDSGGPLVFRHESRYYIRGILSISARKPNAACDTASLAFYTSVSFHRKDIEKYLRIYRT